MPGNAQEESHAKKVILAFQDEEFNCRTLTDVFIPEYMRRCALSVRVFERASEIIFQIDIWALLCNALQEQTSL